MTGPQSEKKFEQSPALDNDDKRCHSLNTFYLSV